MRVRGLVLTQSAYPPLLSASAAVAWQMTGIHTARLGVTTVAVLERLRPGRRRTCARRAGAAAARMAGGELPGGDPRGATAAGRRVAPRGPPVGADAGRVVAAVLLVVVAAGVTEPFLTNGYADPLWSLAAVGAVAFGLQLRDDRRPGPPPWCWSWWPG